MSVFVTDANYKHTPGIVRSLGRKDIIVDVGESSYNRQLSSYSKFSHKSFVYPDPKKDPGFIRFTNRIWKSLNYKVVIPVGYTTTFCLCYSVADRPSGLWKTALTTFSISQ